MDIKNYHIFWIDKYTSNNCNGYVGASHAINPDISMVALCGVDFSKKEMDGGYDDIFETPPSCKKCLKKIEQIENLEKWK